VSALAGLKGQVQGGPVPWLPIGKGIFETALDVNVLRGPNITVNYDFDMTVSSMLIILHKKLKLYHCKSLALLIKTFSYWSDISPRLRQSNR
jgi:hypothetical protein